MLELDSHYPDTREAGMDRDALGELVRNAWIGWASMQPDPKPNWLTLYAELDEADKEADRQIGEAVALATRYEVGACMTLGCGNHGIPCTLSDEDVEDPGAFYCAEHAYKNGFCSGCGQFWAGVESFDLGTPPGYCDNCRDQLEADVPDDEYDEDELPF